jgi:hypothetical protein
MSDQKIFRLREKKTESEKVFNFEGRGRGERGKLSE